MNNLPAHSLTRHAATALLSGLLLWIGFMVYGSTGHDDSHINFWNVHTLLTHGELVNYNGERVEQTTSLLQDFITAFLSLLSPTHLITFGYLVDIAAAFACCILGTRLARQLSPSLAGWMPLLILSSSSFLLWSFGGMGAPLTAFCLLAGICGWHQWLTTPEWRWRPLINLMAVTLALVLVRPEMPIVVIVVALALLVMFWPDARKRKRCLALLSITIVAALGLLALQQLYFGSWLPVPAIAKQGGDAWLQLQRGSFYLLMTSALNPVIPLALLYSVWSGWIWLRQRLKQPSGKAQPVLLIIILCSFWAYGGFIWAAGGDWMQAGRFTVPLIVPAGLLLLYCLAQITQPLIVHVSIILLICLQLGIQYPVVATISHGIPVWVQSQMLPEHAARYSVFEQLNQEHVRDMAIIDHIAELIPPLHEKLERPVLLMSGQAGMVFYYTASKFYGQVQFRDLRGLVESSLTLCPALKNIPRSPQGLNWGYSDFFAQLPVLEQQCNIKPPDIIYDLNGMDQKLGKTLEPLGYTMIHQETGFPVVNKTALPYNRLLAPNMIFVRNDLLPLIGNPSKRVINYRELPLQARWPMSTNTTSDP